MKEVERDRPGQRPVYSIGAAARILGVEPGTLRAWEDRYGLIVPARSPGSQRVYSRDDIARLRYVVQRMEDGSSAADAHRLLADHLEQEGEMTTSVGATSLLILLAERDPHAVRLCEYFLRTEGYEICLASKPADADRMFTERRPDLSIVELGLPGGLELCGRLASVEGSIVLAVSALALHDDAIAAGASAFLPKPFEPIELVSTVRDLLGSSALTRPKQSPAR